VIDLDPQVAQAVNRLAGINIDRLRDVWRARYGAPPRVRATDLLRRLLAERIQVEAYGSDPELEQRIAALVRSYERNGKIARPRAKLNPGSVLVREYSGEIHRVEVIAGGFLWRGQQMRSLSQIAREITGTRWNGPKFFGAPQVERKR